MKAIREALDDQTPSEDVEKEVKATDNNTEDVEKNSACQQKV